MSAKIFDLSYLKPENTFSNIYSLEAFKLEKPIDLSELTPEKVPKTSAFSKYFVNGYDLSSNEELRTIIKQALEELSECQVLQEYRIGFRVKKCEANVQLETAKTINLRGICNNTKKELWFTVSLM